MVIIALKVSKMANKFTTKHFVILKRYITHSIDFNTHLF